MSWTSVNKLAEAIYDFTPADPKDQYQIPLKVGEKCECHEECGGWYKGKVFRANGLAAIGIFPAAYVSVTGDIPPPAPPKRIEPPKPVKFAEPTIAKPTIVEEIDVKQTVIEQVNEVIKVEVKDQTSVAAVRDSLNLKMTKPLQPVIQSSAKTTAPILPPRNNNVTPPAENKSVEQNKTDAAFVPPLPKSESAEAPQPPNKIFSSVSVPQPSAPRANFVPPPPKSEFVPPPPKSENASFVPPPPKSENASFVPPPPKSENSTFAPAPTKLETSTFVPPPPKSENSIAPKPPLSGVGRPPISDVVVPKPPAPKPASTPESSVQKPPPVAMTNSDVPPPPPKSASSTPIVKQATTMPLQPKKATTIVREDTKDELASMTMDSLLSEIGRIITDWNRTLKMHLASGQIRQFYEQKERISILLDLRRQVMSTTESSREEIRKEIISLVESSRRTEEGYMVPRTVAGELADLSNCGVTTLVDLHREMWSSMKLVDESNWALKAKERQNAASSMVKVSEPSLAGLSASKRIIVRDSGGEIAGNIGPVAHFQLMIDVKACIFSVGEATELFFTLYNGRKKQFITEDYCLQLTNSGMPADVSIWGKMKCIFKDLTPDDLNADLYLVCHILRIGRLVFDEKNKDPKKKGEVFYRRPFGVSVMSLNNIEKDVGKELLPPSDAMSIYTSVEESSFSHIHEMIVEKNLQGLELAPRAKGIAFGMTLMAGELPDVKKSKASFVDGIPIPKLNFSEMDPSESRNDFYITLIRGNFLQDGKTSAKNVEIAVRVMTNSGTLVENCVYRGAGHGAIATSEFRSVVTYHENSPYFQETIRLRVPDDIFENCHAFFSIWHVSTNSDKNAPFAFAYLPLTTERGCVIPDQIHDLVCYKPFDSMENPNNGQKFYLNIGDPKLVQRKDSFAVSTCLCSTNRTQNADLHGLFKWKLADVNRLKLTLKNVVSVQGSELVKFLRETFDVLFAILDAKKEVFEVIDPAFTALLYTLDQLTTKFANWCPIVDSYVTDIFSSGRVHTVLLNLVKDKLDYIHQHDKQPVPEKLKNLMLTCKCLKYIVKFMVTSHRIDLASPKPTPDSSSFKANFLDMFRVVNLLMASNVDALVGCKAFILRGFSSVLSDLKLIFTAKEMGIIPCEFLTSVPVVKSRKLNNEKLKLIRNFLDGDVMLEEDSRTLLIPTIISLVQSHMIQIESDDLEEPYLCISILRALFDIFFKIPNEKERTDKIWQLNVLLPQLISTTLKIQRHYSGEHILHPIDSAVASFCKVDALPDTLTLVYSVFHMMSNEQLEKWLDKLASGSKDTMHSFLLNLLIVINTGLKLSVFPDMWVVLHMLQLSVTIKIFTLLLHVMSKHFLQGTSMALDLWKPYFSLGVSLLSNEQLRLEKCSTAKQSFIVQRYGDVRVTVLIPQMRTLWSTLKTVVDASNVNKFGMTINKKQIPLGAPVLKCTSFIVPQLLELARTLSGETKEMSMEFYFDILCCEYEATNSLKDIERHTIDYLYHIANTSITIGDAFMQYLCSNLESRVSAASNLTARGSSFIRDIKQLYDLMCALLKFPDTAIYEDERTSVALKLMAYIENSGIQSRREMYCRYVQYLVDIHIGLKNYVEAAMAQLIHLKQYSWSSKLVDALAKYPAETEMLRKERLFTETIKLFDDGEAWERAISLSEELRKHYEQSFQYEKISELLKLQAGFFSKIVHSERYYSTYYRVVFYGRGFASNAELFEKEFIYRGEKMEPVMDFTNRIKKKFPLAKIHMSSDVPPPELLATNEQVISITTLTIAVQNDLGNISTTDDDNDDFVPPENVQRFSQNNDVKHFYFSKGIQKSLDKKPANEFKDLWVLKVVLTTEESFPTNRRRCLVTSRVDLNISPVENAVISIENKNKELKEKIEKVSMAPEGPVDVGPLSMALNGTIDAAVNGGTQKYIEAFLTASFVSENPDKSLTVSQLKQSLQSQMTTLRTGLEVFGRRCDEQLKGLHEHLEKFYSQMLEKMSVILK